MILFAPPIVCLGAVVPYLVQADTESLSAVGRRAGDLSAAATAGSIFGSFCTGFLLLPLMPVTVLLGATSASLIVLGLAADRLLDTSSADRSSMAGIVALPLLGMLASGSPPDALYHGQSVYGEVTGTACAMGMSVCCGVRAVILPARK